MSDETKKIADGSDRPDELVGVFVSAQARGGLGTRQGWITKTNPLTIRAQSGMVYICDGIPIPVTNPPKRNPNRVIDGKGEL